MAGKVFFMKGMDPFLLSKNILVVSKLSNFVMGRPLD
jgi:hypothetical protein